jgi:hypothetical protein
MRCHQKSLAPTHLLPAVQTAFVQRKSLILKKSLFSLLLSLRENKSDPSQFT